MSRRNRTKYWPLSQKCDVQARNRGDGTYDVTIKLTGLTPKLNMRGNNFILHQERGNAGFHINNWTVPMRVGIFLKLFGTTGRVRTNREVSDYLCR